MDIEARLDDVERRLGRTEDRQEIMALAVRYGEMVDSFDRDGVRSLFTEDARWAWANGMIDARGVDAVMDTLTGRQDTIDGSLHVVHGHRVDLDESDPDEATGVLFSHAEVVREGNPMISAMRYDDVYRRVDGRWRFAERVLSFFYYVNADSYVADLSSGTPVRTGSGSVAADLPSGA